VSPLAQAAQSALARRDMSQMSFAFACSPSGQTWNKDYRARRHRLDLFERLDPSTLPPASPTTSAATDQAASRPKGANPLGLTFVEGDRPRTFRSKESMGVAEFGCWVCALTHGRIEPGGWPMRRP